VNLLPFLEGTSSGEYGAPAAVRKGRCKLHRNGSQASRLFDLAADVGEATDLAAAQPAVVAELEADLSAWKAELIPPLW
jgi:hypothetical protein